jgi:pimeloyl-ACP methyl ester carboxylesterase
LSKVTGRARARAWSDSQTDWIALNLPWGFSVAEIRCPARIWWGDADPIMSRLETEHLAKMIRRSVLRVYPGEGHAIMLTHWADMLAAMG